MSEEIVITGSDADAGKSMDSETEQPQSLIDWKGIWKPLIIIVGAFLVFFWLPIDSSRFTGAVIESLALAKWYAREHVILCLIPAFFYSVPLSASYRRRRS